jgi:hypothetical protein
MRPKLQEKPSNLKREHPALQNMRYLFSFWWVIFALLDPDPIRIRNICNKDNFNDKKQSLTLYGVPGIPDH